MTESISCQVTSAELAQIDECLLSGQTRSEWLYGLVTTALSKTTANVQNLTVSTEAISPPPSPKSSLPPSSTPSIYDVEEDEPDEILYEFLEPEPSSSSSPQSSLPPSPSPGTSIYDAEDDEPYEILYDFLEPEEN